MALLWADGFDHYGSSAKLVESALYVYRTNSGSEPLQIGSDPSLIRTGGHYWDASGLVYLNWYGGRIVGGNSQVMGTGAAFYFPHAPAGDNFCPFMFLGGDKDQCQVSVRLNVDGSLSLYSGRDGAVYATSDPGVVTWGAYAYIEAAVFCDSNVGTAQIRVNNVPVLAITDFDTNPIGSGKLTGIMIGTRNFNASGPNPICLAISDFVIWDNSTGRNNTWMGDIRCRTIYPASNGAEQDWTVNGAASAFEAVNNVPSQPNVEYIEAANVGDASTFNMTPIPTNTSTVFGAMLFAQVNKGDAGVCEVTPGIVSNGQVLEGAPINPGTGNAYYTSTYATNPDGGGNLTWQAINAIQTRLERTQ